MIQQPVMYLQIGRTDSLTARQTQSQTTLMALVNAHIGDKRETEYMTSTKTWTTVLFSLVLATGCGTSNSTLGEEAIAPSESSNHMNSPEIATNDGDAAYGGPDRPAQSMDAAA